jgi:predicted AlkP superfamily pyrophosphatase or phosphodiesterase
VYGPRSKEVIDTLYHIDQELGDFISFCSSKIAPERTLFILTADHGTHPIIDQLNKQGISFARRVSAQKLINELNELVQKKYDLSEKLVRTFENSQLYLNTDLLKNFPRKVRNKIVRDLVSYIKKQPGVRNAWTYEELSKSIFEPWNLDRYFKYQLYPERSGHIIICEQPYTEIDGHTNGTSHTSPYTSDTNVPLIFYQNGRFETERIDRTVYLTQLAPTIASILNVPRPSAATASVLKEVISRKRA